jgi:hypothetical protein
MTRDEAITAIDLGMNLAEPHLSEMHGLMIVAMSGPGQLPRLLQCYVLAMFLGGTATGLLEVIEDPLVDVANLDGFGDIPRFTPMLRAAADLLDEIHHEQSAPLMNGHDDADQS